MKVRLQKTISILTTIVISITNVFSQSDTSNSGHYNGLSLKDLLDLKIVSVSKKTERLFDAPLSASVVTREEIQRTGCNTIMEALRLVPGIIVREQSNGNYDIHIRGMDNIPPNGSFDMASSTTLVMIDNRPVYSYMRGGTFWETLPVDINDVEKIEVVRGPAAALYGPNAVNGVINIITRQAKKQGLYIVANTQQGSNRTFINNASVGYKTGKWSFIASGNYQLRHRSQTSYFEFFRNQWFDKPEYSIRFLGDTTWNITARYPDQEMAMEKYAGNFFVDYEVSKDIKFALSTGVQQSVVQRVSAENEITPLSTSNSNTRYVDFRANVKGISAQFSYNGGLQNIDYDPGNKYDFHTMDANIEYNYTRSKLSIKPGLNYRSTVYDDTKYSDIIKKAGIFNARGNITTLSPSLRIEYKMLNNKLRLVGGLTAHKFNYPDTTYISSQLAATYKMNRNHLVRAVLSKATRSSNIFDTYVDQTIAFYPSGFRQFTRLALWGNKSMKLLTADMFEVGYRGNITSRLNVDLEVFEIRARNASVMVNAIPFSHTEGSNTIVEQPIVSTNLPLRLSQQGVTISLTYSSNKLQVKPFVTVQRTRIRDYSPNHNMPDAIPGVTTNIYSGMGTEALHKSTPSVFGGASINYLPTSKININLNSYYYSAQTYHHLSNTLFNDGVRGIDTIRAKLIINLTASFEAARGFHIFISGKNILNDRSREFYRSDEVPFRLMAGINYEF